MKKAPGLSKHALLIFIIILVIINIIMLIMHVYNYEHGKYLGLIVALMILFSQLASNYVKSGTRLSKTAKEFVWLWIAFCLIYIAFCCYHD